MHSRIALWVSIIILVATHLYYPKWTMTGTEATISWDVSGYYMYLPALFIYHDIEDLEFKDMMMTKYKPTGDFQQARMHEESGHYVMKYAVGQAVVFSPFFFIGHAYACLHPTYPADGYSRPYQVAITMGMLLVTFLGLIILRHALLRLFDDTTVALGLLGIVIGSNYLNYAGIDGAMTHNTLFTVYALLLFTTMKFYAMPSLKRAIGIGALIGLAALIRPTEIISCLIPLLWGVCIWRGGDWRDRWTFISTRYPLFLAALLTCIAVGSLQLIYWKSVSGDWLVYSYGKQGFDWLSPHFDRCLYSYKAGWFTYSPLMSFAVLGFIPLFRRDAKLFSVTFSFCLLFMYIAFSWSEWWYGGSLGQRALIQGYPMFAIPLCAFIVMVRRWGWVRYVILGIALLFCYMSVWFVHQTHHGGLIPVSQVTGPYYWRTLLTYDKVLEHRKLLDNVDELYEGEFVQVDTLVIRPEVVKLTNQVKWSPSVIINRDQLPKDYDWIRASATCSIGKKEWNKWLMSQMIITVLDGDREVDRQMFRVQRHVPVDNQTRSLHLDLRKPEEPFTHLRVQFFKGNGAHPIQISDVVVMAGVER